jgi:hypothetical protein
MKSIIGSLALVALLAVSLASAPRSSHAGAGAIPTAKTCYFVRNHLPCPCPRAQKARAVARAARVTAEAVGSAIGTTASALSKVDQESSKR